MNGLSLRVAGKASKENFKTEKVSPAFEPFSSTFREFVDPTDFDEFRRAASVPEQLNFFKNYPGANSLKLLLGIFFEASPKHPLKNMSRKLLNSKTRCIEDVRVSGAEYLKKLLFETLNSPASVRNDVCCGVNGCFENFEPGCEIVNRCLKETAAFLDSFLGYLLCAMKEESASLMPADRSDYLCYIHNIVKTLVNVLQKCSILTLKMEENMWMSYANNTVYLFTECDIQMDTKVNASMVFVLIMKCLSGEDVLFKIMQNGNRLDKGTVKYLNSDCTLSNESLICFFSAIVNVVDIDSLLENTVNGEAVLDSICKQILKMSEEISAETTAIIGITRFMLTLSRSISKNKHPDRILPAVDAILIFIWTYLEYYVNSVKHLTIEILTNIIKISIDYNRNGYNTLSNMIFESIGKLSFENETKYKGLSILAGGFGCDIVLEKNPNLINEMISIIQKINNTSSVVSAFNNMMSAHEKEINVEVFFNIWVKPICEAIRNNLKNKITNRLDVYEEILLNMVKTNSDVLSYIIEYLVENKNISEINSDEDYKLLLISLYAARKTNYYDSKCSTDDLWKNTISFNILDNIINHYDSDICLLAFYVIIESHKTTELFTEKEFEIIFKFLHYNINVQFPALRQKILSGLKKMMNRWNNGYFVIRKNNESNLDKIYVDFINQLWHLCMKNLFYGSNYSRRNISLNLLCWCLNLDHKFDTEEHWRREDVLRLVEILDDSYECNKILAVTVLSYCPISLIKTYYIINTADLLNNVIKKASSLKPTDCSTSAYTMEMLLNFPPLISSAFNDESIHNQSSVLFANHLSLIKLLISHLKCELKAAEINILQAAANGPMYGLLHCIKHILKIVDLKKVTKIDNWQSCISEIIEIMITVSHVVGPIVNNDSPEGFMPMDFGELNTENVTSQMVLVCAWRSIKEVSLILGDLSFRGISNDDLTAELVNEDQLLKIGDHFITLLSETKHRGAFEQAYLGFTQLCSRLWICKTEKLCKLPTLWLDDMIDSILAGNLNNSKLCATRRSAGVPFIIQSLVITELQVTGSTHNFHRCMSTLLKLTSFDSSNTTSVETRTHCLNILRALFKHSALGDFVNMYVADGLITAIRGFDGNSWAERNSSTLLFSSLMTRIFGVQRTKDSDDLCIRNRMTGRIFFLRYPKLYDYILNYLKCFQSDIDVNYLRPSLYPILLLLSRLYPSSLEGTESNFQLVDFIPYLLKCHESPVLKTRQLTAKAIVSVIPQDMVVCYLKKMITLLCDENIKTNFCHGVLLQISRLLKMVPNDYKIEPNECSEFILLFRKSLWVLKSRKCLITSEIYILNLLQFLKKFPIFIQTYQSFFTSISDEMPIELSAILKLHYNKEQYNCAILDYKMYVHIISGDIEKAADLLMISLNHRMYEIVQSSLKYIFCLYTNDPESIYCDKFEISPHQIEFIANLSTDVKEKLLKVIEYHAHFNELVNLSKSNENILNKEISLYLLSKAASFSITSLTNHECLEQQLIFLMDIHNNDIDVFRPYYLKLINRTLKAQNENKLLHNMINETVLETLLLHLYNLSSPGEASEVRMETADIFISNFNLFDWELKSFKSCDKVILQLAIILQLLDDEEHSIRQHISKAIVNFVDPREKKYLKMKYMSHNLAKEIVVNKYKKLTESQPIALSIGFWLLLAFTDTTYEEDTVLESQVFDKGEINTFREDLLFCQMCFDHVENLIENSTEFSKPRKLQDAFVLLDGISKNELFTNFSKYQKICNCLSVFIKNCQTFIEKQSEFQYDRINEYIESQSANISTLEYNKIKAALQSLIKPFV